jgi:hypothetical protein
MSAAVWAEAGELRATAMAAGPADWSPLRSRVPATLAVVALTTVSLRAVGAPTVRPSGRRADAGAGAGEGSEWPTMAWMNSPTVVTGTRTTNVPFGPVRVEPSWPGGTPTNADSPSRRRSS